MFLKKIISARTLWAVKKSGFMECTVIIIFYILKFEFKFHSSWKCERIYFLIMLKGDGGLSI